MVEEYAAEGANAKRLTATHTFADDLVAQTRYDQTGMPGTSFVQADEVKRSAMRSVGAICK